MSLKPFKLSLNLQLVTLLDLCQNGLYNILVLHRFSGRGLPPIFSPVDEPQRNAINSIATIRCYNHISISRGNFKSSQNSSELSTLVCLPCSWQSFGDVSNNRRVSMSYISAASHHELPFIAGAEVNAHTSKSSCRAISKRTAICMYADRYGLIFPI